MSFSYIYSIFLLNETHINPTLTNTARYLLSFAFLLFSLSLFIYLFAYLGSQYIYKKKKKKKKLKAKFWNFENKHLSLVK